jgi:hypothetical protein
LEAGNACNSLFFQWLEISVVKVPKAGKIDPFN